MNIHDAIIGIGQMKGLFGEATGRCDNHHYLSDDRESLQKLRDEFSEISDKLASWMIEIEQLEGLGK